MSDDRETFEMEEGTGQQQDISWIFGQYCDRNGRIPVRQFEDIIEKYRTSLSEQTIRKLLNYANTNRDQYISRDEIQRLQAADPDQVARDTDISVRELTVFNRGVNLVGRFILPDKNDQKTYSDKYTCCPPPLFMILVSLVEVGIYIYYGATYDVWLTYPSQLIDSPLTFNPLLRHEAWRFVSYMLLHAGLEHVLFNTLVQLMLGIPLEMVHGGLRVGCIYMAGVIGGSLASSVFDPRVALVGASGGVYALFTAQLANVILNGDIMNKLWSLFRAAFVSIVLCADFGYSIYRRLSSDTESNVSFTAHVAGAIAGLTMGLMVLSNFKQSLSDKVAFWIAVGSYCAFTVFAIFWNIFWPGYDTSYRG